MTTTLDRGASRRTPAGRPPRYLVGSLTIAFLLATAPLGSPPPAKPRVAAPRAEQQLIAPGCKPGEVLDLRSWKLTLPTGSDSSPIELLPIHLGGLLRSPWFHPTSGCDGLVFRAPVNGATTKGSNYPRSELRELTDAGTPAGWSADDGTHWTEITAAFTAVPQGKPDVVVAQVHDAHDDVSVFRLEGSRLYVTRGNDPHYQLVDADYRLGTTFDAGFLVTRNVLGAYFDRRLVAVIPGSFSGAYFKAGAYTQSNCSNSPCTSDNYGETTIFALRTGHQ